VNDLCRERGDAGRDSRSAQERAHWRESQIETPDRRAEGGVAGPVILVSVGLPGPLSRWCDAVMASLAGRLGGEVASGTWPGLDEMFGFEPAGSILESVGQFLVRNNARHVVIGARQPDQALRLVFAESGTRFVLALDDPADAVAAFIDETGVDPNPAVRAVAKSCPFVMQFNGLPGALAIDAALVRDNPEAAIAAIAAHFGIETDQQARAAILDAVGPPGGEAWRQRRQSLEERLPVAARKMIDGALSGYREAFRTGRIDQLVWTRDLFLLAPPPGGSPTEPIDISGGNQVLTYGPYIHLPPGDWSAQIVLGFSPQAAAATFEVDVFADGQLARTSLVPGSPGIHAATLIFSIGEPSGKGVEVRVMVTSGTAAGSVAFGRVVLQPFSVPGADLPGHLQVFESVLQL
jgi:hypothetical protein